MKTKTYKEFVKESEDVNEAKSSVYVVIPFYSDGVSINENDVMVFKKYNNADNYKNGLEGSPIIIETELK